MALLMRDRSWPLIAGDRATVLDRSATIAGRREAVSGAQRASRVDIVLPASVKPVGLSTGVPGSKRRCDISSVRAAEGAAMTGRRVRFVLSVSTSALVMFAAMPAIAQTSQGCGTHLGQSVQLPPGLPAGSFSVRFVQDGTVWQTPDGQQVTVPQATFPPCSSPTTPTTPPTTPTK